MKLFIVIFILFLSGKNSHQPLQQYFDVHLHGSENPTEQIRFLKNAGVSRAAISSSWAVQNRYKNDMGIEFLQGLMIPCPAGKVPYSLQSCFKDGKDWPSLIWVEERIREGSINFIGEILSQYYGISSSDSLLFPYYALAEKYSLPVGIHTGGAGPGHGSASFKPELGNPEYLEETLKRFPNLKIWIMHSGDMFFRETITLMRKYPQVYADISVISNPDIMPPTEFSEIMENFIDADLEDRLMFGTDNGNPEKIIANIRSLEFLSAEQRDKLFLKNAERFFKR